MENIKKLERKQGKQLEVFLTFSQKFIESGISYLNESLKTNLSTVS